MLQIRLSVTVATDSNKAFSSYHLNLPLEGVRAPNKRQSGTKLFQKES